MSEDTSVRHHSASSSSDNILVACSAPRSPTVKLVTVRERAASFDNLNKLNYKLNLSAIPDSKMSPDLKLEFDGLRNS